MRLASILQVVGNGQQSRAWFLDDQLNTVGRELSAQDVCDAYAGAHATFSYNPALDLATQVQAKYSGGQNICITPTGWIAPNLDVDQERSNAIWGNIPDQAYYSLPD